MAHLVFAKPLVGTNVHDFFDWVEEPGWPNEYAPYMCERFTPGMVPKALKPAKMGQDLSRLPKIGRVMYGLCVHREFKDVLEALEPSRHQFFPVVLQGYDGAEVSQDYCLLNILQCIDAMELERSNLHWALEIVSGMPPRREGCSPPLFIQRAAVEGRHLWRSNQVAKAMMYFSNELMAAVESVGRDNLITFAVEEVS